jgi:predicted DNA-binding protein with PD1-like motif
VDIDAMLLTASGSLDPATVGSAPPEDEEDGDRNTVKERNMDISSLGNLATLSVGPFIHDY